MDEPQTNETPAESEDSASSPVVQNGWLVDAIGWAGTALILGAYALLSLDVVSAGKVYQAMNLLGAAGVGVVCWRQRTWQPLFLQVVWAVIAVVSLLRMGA